MESDNEPVKPEDTEGEGSVQEKKHGFASHGSGTWDQDEMIASAEKDSTVQLPPKSKTQEKA